MVVGLSACGSGSGNGNFGNIGGNNNNNDADANVMPADLRFIALTVDGEPGTGNDFIVGDGMPVAGPGISLGN